MKNFKIEVFGSRSGSGLENIMDPDPVCPERLDSDPVCPERLDPDPVNIRPDPKPWRYYAVDNQFELFE